MNSKAFYLSKTFWVNLLMALCPAIPGASDFLNAHPMLVAEIFAGVNIALRFLTHSAVTLS